MLNNDSLAMTTDLDRQINNVIAAMAEANNAGDSVELSCLQADYDSLAERIAAIRMEAYAEAPASDGMTQKIADRLAELECLNRWINARIGNLKMLEYGSAEYRRGSAELAEQALRRITLQNELASLQAVPYGWDCID